MLPIEQLKIKDAAEQAAKIEYLKQCRYLLPPEIAMLPEEMLQEFALQVTTDIVALGDGHMLEYTPAQALTDLRNGHSLILWNPNDKQVISFVKAGAWQNGSGVACWEIGSLFTSAEFQGLGIGKFMVNALCDQTFLAETTVPVMAVVTVDNGPSLKLFRNLGWSEKTPSAEATTNYYNYDLNGANIYQDWGLASSIFIKNGKS